MFGNKTLLTIVATVLLGCSAAYVFMRDGTSLAVDRALYSPTISIHGVSLRVEVAATEAERTLGLSGRTALPSTSGMLFVFPAPQLAGIWMKDMFFSIDVLWLDEKGTIVYIEQNMSPQSYPKVFGPNVPVKYVVELPAGFIENYTVAVGETVQLGTTARN
jgi:uncharacterized membrane protein (UPF0127 family)